MHKTSKTEFKSTMIPIEELTSQHLQTLDCFVLSTMSTLDIMEQGSKYPMSASQTNSSTLARDQLPSQTTPHGTLKLSKILCYTFFFSQQSFNFVYLCQSYIHTEFFQCFGVDSNQPGILTPRFCIPIGVDSKQPQIFLFFYSSFALLHPFRFCPMSVLESEQNSIAVFKHPADHNNNQIQKKEKTKKIPLS